MNNIERNLTMLCDFYELTMANGYLKCGYGDKYTYFDVFYRSNPDGGGYAIAAGLEQIINYINDLHFTEQDIEFLRSKGIFDEEFLDYLRNFKFEGDVWAVPEGTVIFPNEPVITVRAKAPQAQFIETYILMQFNHQSCIATKASRMVRAAEGRAISEFGSRRAQGADAAILGARAAYIGGVGATACTISDEYYHVPSTGTMAHSWVQMFPDEYTAFKNYCEIYPENATLLVDTYNVLESGIPNAIKAFKEVLVPKGIKKCAIRLDSGDITYLTTRARKMLDEAGFDYCKIVVSNSLDEHIIRDIIRQGAQVDAFGIGERLITAKSCPVFGGVYKLVAIEEEDGTVTPKIKISENPQKITNPHFKKVYRIYNNENGKAEADIVCVHDEEIDDSKPIEIFDPHYTWKRKVLENVTAVPLQERIFDKGRQVYSVPDIDESRRLCAAQLESMWKEVLRWENPHDYYVDLSEKLWNIKDTLLRKLRNKQ
ncbi:MAG: nicotinate phosphoribosyltransferase [Clostridia bacterium]|nr:nicotinate phosphoribosyltransferase [Clostridia bacterium]